MLKYQKGFNLKGFNSGPISIKFYELVSYLKIICGYSKDILLKVLNLECK